MKHKRLVVGLVILLVVLCGALAISYYNVSHSPKPVLEQSNTPQPTAVMEAKMETLKSGPFTAIDVIHKGSGTASIIKTKDNVYLQLSNFSVTPGPNLYVYASPNPASAGLGDYTVIGKLKSFSGDQVYNLPPTYTTFKSIVIWCQSFSVTFSTADLQ